MNGLFSDLLIKMYGISTLLKYVEKLDNNFDDLLKWTMQRHVFESQMLLKEICDQFKNPWFFRWLVLPWGINKTKPSIELQSKIVNQLINDKHLKNTLTDDVLIIKDSPLDELERAYELAIDAEKIYKRVRYVDDAEGVDALLDQEKITSEEHQLLSNLTQLRRKILAVDDYEN